jgi:trehalose 6-phosphate phosphatase
VLDLFEPFRRAPERAAILTDFDGTLAPIVEDPAAAAPLPGVPEVLRRLAARYAVVGVVSGRPVSFLRGHLGDELWLSGLYGLETLQDGRLIESPEAATWRPVVHDAAQRASAELGAGVEDKGLSLTLHFRTAPARAPEYEAWARAEGARSGLRVRAAKASVELHPPVAADKGTVVRAAAAGLEHLCFLGDDVGDLPAFAVATVSVAVATEETPVELIDRADLVVGGPEGALALLERLARSA